MKTCSRSRSFSRFLASAPLGVALVCGSPALAQKIDLSTITCKAFLEDEKSQQLIMMWLDGYYSTQDSDPVVDFDAMKGKMQKLAEFCSKNPTIGLITAVEPIFEE